jgi:outer membrane protein OmpA-like peptidoglycan-associated protein
MKNIIFGVACLFVLTGCANNAVRDSLGIQDPTVLQTGFDAEQSARAGAAVEPWNELYGRIGSPHRALVLLQARLDQMDDRKNSYFGFKDQCWIDTAKSELEAGDRWGFVEESIGEAARLTAGLEGSQPLTFDNSPLRTVAPLRNDLKEGLRAALADPRILNCPQAQKQIACSEVGLMHAGHDAWTRQFNAARAKVDKVQSTLADVQHSLESCGVPAEHTDGPNPEPTAVALPTDMLFAFDRSTIESITMEGRQKLDGFIGSANEWKNDGAGKLIMVSGFTDRLGSDAYNLRLSQRRAEAVRRYLIDGGVTAEVRAQGYGRSSPGTECGIRSWRALVACLANDRRVELRFLHAVTAFSEPTND